MPQSLKFAIIDVESTGGDPKVDRLTEIAIFIHDGKGTIDQYTTLINPEMPIKPFVASLTKISDEMVEGAPTFAEIAEKVLEITQGCIFVAHNVRFDYTMVSNEYRRLGLTFRRKLLDTIKLSKELFPGYTAYGLSKLCQELGISMSNRHRAFGDAEATTELFDILIKKDRNAVMREVLNQEISDSVLPQHLSRAQVDALPEDTGVYYFRDEADNNIYISKSSNIRQRVITHFSESKSSPKMHRMKEIIHSVDYIVTGSELIALIEECRDVKKWSPEFNTYIKKKKYKFGIYPLDDKNGYTRLNLKNIGVHEPPLKFTNKRIGHEVLQKLTDIYQLCYCLNGLQKSENTYCKGYELGTCRGACLAEEDITDYNLRANRAILAGEFTYPTFFIITDGRIPQEKGIILIEDNKYQGYGYIKENEVQIKSLEDIRAYIDHQEHEQDIHKIIFQYVNNYPTRVRMVVLA